MKEYLISRCAILFFFKFLYGWLWNLDFGYLFDWDRIFWLPYLILLVGITIVTINVFFTLIT